MERDRDLGDKISRYDSKSLNSKVVTLAVKSESVSIWQTWKRSNKKLSQQQHQKVQISHDIRVTRLGEASGVCFLHTQLETTTSAE